MRVMKWHAPIVDGSGGHPHSRLTLQGRLPLTLAEHDLYREIVSHFARYGFPPTIRSLARTMGYRSANGAMCIIKMLRRKGWLKPCTGCREPRDIVPAELAEKVKGIALKLHLKLNRPLASKGTR